MIKGTLFSKLLKQSLFISLISCFILLGNFSSSYYDQSFVLDYSTEIQDDQGNNFEFIDYGNFLLNNVYRVFSVYATGTQNNKFLWNVFWNPDGYLYFVASCEGSSSPCSNSQNKSINEFIKMQGKPQYFGLCNDTNSINAQYGPCNPFDFDKNQASSFYSDTYSNPDELRVFGTDDLSNFNFCFHYDSLGKYVCFYINTSWNLESSLGFVENPLYSQLGNSTLLNSVSCSPWGCPSIGGDQDNSVIVDNCTYSEIFNFLNLNGYNDYLCYGGLDNFNLYDSTLTYNPVPGSGKTLGQILSYSSSWDTPNDWFVFWNGLYLDKNNPTFNSMWESYPAVYRTWFDLYYRYGGSTLVFDSVREYCAMRQLDVDFDTTFYKGQYFKNTCSTIKMNYGTGDSENAVGVDWDGVGNHGSGSSVSNDPVVFIQNFFGQLKENFPTRYDLGGGFLPVYIITFLCALVLFRFLSH